MVVGYLAGAWLRPVLAATCLPGRSVRADGRQPGRRVPLHRTERPVLLRRPAGCEPRWRAPCSPPAPAQVRQLRAVTELRQAQRATEVRTAALEERNRVEAEVTQALMQRIGAVVVQVSGARVHPDREAMVRIEQAGRAALDDLRTALGSLRAGDPPPTVPGSANRFDESRP